ncbi:MAG: hypothetical protein JXQ29_03730, partial [Planctomycetes bacterium]|nr:hypothetical protein [Planctomycetota bacterium]
AILLASLLSFGPGLGNGFVYDDPELVVDNTSLPALLAGVPGLDSKPRSHLLDLLTCDYSALGRVGAPPPEARPLGNFRPVIVLSYVADAWFWSAISRWPAGPPLLPAQLRFERLNPVGFHLTNLFFHSLNALLVFVIARSLTRRFAPALAAGLFHAVHPVHTESVCWIAGRTDVIAAAFFLAAFWLHLRARRRGGRAGRVSAGLAWLLFAAAVLAKEAALVLPGMLLVIELVRAPARGAGRGSAVRSTLPFFLIAAVYLAGRAALLAGRGDDSFLEAGTLASLPTSTLAATFLRASAWYLGKCLWPFPFHPFPDIAFVSLGEVLHWAPSLLLHAALLVLAVGLCRARRAPLVALAILGFYVSLAPLSSLVPGARLARFTEDQAFPVAERFLYLPSVMVVLGLAWLVARWARGRTGRRLALAAVALLTAGTAAANVGRTAIYRDNLSFFRAAVAAAPRSVRMNARLGAQHLARFEPEAALLRHQYAHHLQVHLPCPPVQMGLAAAARWLERPELYPQAADALRRALELDPKHLRAGVKLEAVLKRMAPSGKESR